MLSIQDLKSAIETLHKCKARHLESVPVADHYWGQVAWKRVVETFGIEGHPRASRCHAWWYVDDDGPQCVTVLEVPPVDSAETAVKVSVSAGAGK